jgi:hypothetical protein
MGEMLLFLAHVNSRKKRLCEQREHSNYSAIALIFFYSYFSLCWGVADGLAFFGLCIFYPFFYRAFAAVVSPLINIKLTSTTQSLKKKQKNRASL